MVAKRTIDRQTDELDACKDAVRRVLSRTRAIDAVYLTRDDSKVVHVYSVVREFDRKNYQGLLKREREIETENPDIAFEFHLRAHQGREPAQAVPWDAELVYER